MKPLLLLDIDGVLNPLGVREAPGYTAHRIAGLPVLLNPRHGLWLTELAEAFDVTWASSWERDADLIARHVGLPIGLPFVEFTDQSGWTVKLPAVARYVGGRAVAWVDDVFGPEDHAWAAARAARTLLVQADHRVGLTLEHVQRLQRFADGRDE